MHFCRRQKLKFPQLLWCFQLGFFRHCATISIFFAFKGSHLQVSFDILQQTKVPKSPKGLPVYVLRHYEIVQNSHFSFFFRKLKKIDIFCLQRVPFDILLFDILQQTGFSKSPKGPRFYRFKNFLSADFRRSRLVLVLHFKSKEHF